MKGSMRTMEAWVAVPVSVKIHPMKKPREVAHMTAIIMTSVKTTNLSKSAVIPHGK